MKSIPLFKPNNTQLYFLAKRRRKQSVPNCMALYRTSSAPPSSSFCVNVFILLLWCGLLVTSVIGGNNETDRSALLEFKAKIIHDLLGALNSWNDSIHFCQWKGVTCGRLTSKSHCVIAISEIGRLHFTIYWKFNFFEKSNPPKQLS